jgi:hypothetical protein
VTEPQPSDHVRVTENRTDDDGTPRGVYRVVRTGERVALLLVGDASDPRETTGEVAQVSRSTDDSFETAENPDAGFSLGSLLPLVRTWATAVRYWLPF